MGLTAKVADRLISAKSQYARSRPNLIKEDIYTSSRSKNFKVALYSHDAMGLGHLRRNILIASTISKFRIKCGIMIISGTREANNFKLPNNVDFLTLPAYYKNKRGNYSPKNLYVDINTLVNIRSKSINSALSYFDPDLFIIDKIPNGVMNELEITLKTLKERGKANIVLGLRDILDTPNKVKSEWEKNNYYDVVNKFYDYVWVYGDPSVYDIEKEYDLEGKIDKKIKYTGYLVFKDLDTIYKERRKHNKILNLPDDGKFIVCLLGGGQDGVKLANAFSSIQFPKGYYGVILTGPFMPNLQVNKLDCISEINPKLFVFNFVPDPMYLIKESECVISMGGYNTTCELLALSKRALVIPRVKPRKEQLIRAMRMSDLGLIDMIHPDDLTPEYLTSWISNPGRNLKTAKNININGLSRLSKLIKQILNINNKLKTDSVSLSK